MSKLDGTGPIGDASRQVVNLKVVVKLHRMRNYKNAVKEWVKNAIPGVVKEKRNA